MCDVMMFPDTAEEFIEQYKIVDTDQVYTNGAELIPIFRMKQWLEHLQDIEPERKTGRWIGNPETCEFMTCSACGCEFDWVSEGGYPSNEWAYCPECGAFMGGELESER